MPISSSFNLKDAKANASFVCSLSDELRLGVMFMPSTQEKIEKLAHGVVKTILEAEGVADSLHKESLPGVSKAVRQIDLRGSDMNVMLKSFTFWNPDLKCWHVLLEGPNETFWEEKHKQGMIGRG